MHIVDFMCGLGTVLWHVWHPHPIPFHPHFPRQLDRDGNPHFALSMIGAKSIHQHDYWGSEGDDDVIVWSRIDLGETNNMTHCKGVKVSLGNPTLCFLRGLETKGGNRWWATQKEICLQIKFDVSNDNIDNGNAWLTSTTKRMKWMMKHSAHYTTYNQPKHHRIYSFDVVRGCSYCCTELYSIFSTSSPSTGAFD